VLTRAGVGFSYSSNKDDYGKLNDTVAATDNYAFLQAFFAAYPQYQSNALW
jgi:carboxypeptidase C (cathepsin A)